MEREAGHLCLVSFALYAEVESPVAELAFARPRTMETNAFLSNYRQVETVSPKSHRGHGKAGATNEKTETGDRTLTGLTLQSDIALLVILFVTTVLPRPLGPFVMSLRTPGNVCSFPFCEYCIWIVIWGVDLRVRIKAAA